MERGVHQAHGLGHVGLLPGPHQPALAPGQQGRLDEPRAPELSGARAHGGCNRGGSGQGRSSLVSGGAPSTGRPLQAGQGQWPLLDLILGYQEISKKCWAQHFILGTASQPHN